MKKIEIYLVAGRAGVGKSTYASELASKINAEIFEISKTIKDITKELYDGDIKDNTGRSTMQRIGREGREINSGIFVHETMNRIFQRVMIYSHHFPKKKVFRFIIPDLRLISEYKEFKNSFENVELHFIEREFESKLTNEQMFDRTEIQIPYLKNKADKVINIV